MFGIAVGWYCGIEVPHILFLSLLSLIALFLGLWRDAPRWLFGVAASVLMFTAGMFVEECEEERKAPQWAAEKLQYSALLLEEPVAGDATLKALADVSLCSESSVFREQGRVYLYFPVSAEAKQLRVGDKVLFEARIQPFANAGNPAEFDAERYYYIKGISGFSFIGRGGWEWHGECKPTLFMRAMSARAKVIGMYRDLSFDGEELALLSALTVGEKRDFPKELKENYSVAGASHILALSGMHLGVFYILLITLLPLRGTNRILMLGRETVVVLLLWVFAFVAGLSPSIVRAAILFTLMSVGRCLRQDSSAVSSLSFAAIVMLLFSPHFLFDISFQLSFAAVLSILVLSPLMQNALKVKERGAVVRYLLNIFVLTVAAQVGTLPLVWYYFGVFPLYFVLTNFVVVPLAFLVMTLSVLVWVLVPAPFVQQLPVTLLRVVVGTMNGCVSLVASLPGASLSLPPVDTVGVFVVASLLILFVCGLVKRCRWLSGFAACGMLLFVVVLVMTAPDKCDGNYVIIYNNGRNPLLHTVGEEGRNYLVSTVQQSKAEYDYVSSPYIKREKLEEPVWVSGAYADSLLSLHNGLLSFDNLRIRMVDDGLWQENIYVEPADIVILCRGFAGKVAELVEAFPAGCVVLDASLYANSRTRILQECAALGLEPVDLLVTGAMKVVSDDETIKLVPLRGK